MTLANRGERSGRVKRNHTLLSLNIPALRGRLTLYNHL